MTPIMPDFMEWVDTTTNEFWVLKKDAPPDVVEKYKEWGKMIDFNEYDGEE